MTLRELRKQRGLTLEALAVLAGIDPGGVSKIERGLAQPRPETVVKLARALGIGARRMNAIVAESVFAEADD